MAASPQFAALPQTILKQISTATVGLKTSPTTGTTLLITGKSAVGYSGTKITTIAVKAQATNLASTLLIFITDDGGTAASGLLFDEITIPATTSSTTAVSARAFSLYTDLQLMPNQAVYVSCTIATNTVPINVFVSAGDF
tara:strand:+ start:139 stop:558 length:420 start_codon:yes stop_codon:yes gene_type:complete